MLGGRYPEDKGRTVFSRSRPGRLDHSPRRINPDDGSAPFPEIERKFPIAATDVENVLAANLAGKIANQLTFKPLGDAAES